MVAITSTFKRIASGLWQEIFQVPPKDKAKWTPAPTDARGAWLGWEFALTGFDSGMGGGPELDLIYHAKGEPIWSSVGAGDGGVYVSGATFEQDVATAGGFHAWLTPVLAEINARIAAKCAQLDPAPPLVLGYSGGAIPATFASFREWLHNDGVWTGGVTPPGPAPQPAPVAFLGDYWDERNFELGFATETGLRFHADGRIERIERIMIPNVGWQMLPHE